MAEFLELCPNCREKTKWKYWDNYYSQSADCLKCNKGWDSEYLRGWRECYAELTQKEVINAPK